MPAYFFRSEPGAAELRRLARRESGRVCQRVLMIANMLEGMEHEEAARLAGLSRSAAYEWHNRYEEDGLEGLRDRPRPGRQPRVDAVTSARFKDRIVAGAELARDGVVAFRGVDAQRILKVRYTVDKSLTVKTGFVAPLASLLMYWPTPIWRWVMVPEIGAVTIATGSSFCVGWASSEAISLSLLPRMRSRLRTARSAISSLRTVFCAVIRSVCACCQSLSAPPCAR